MSDVTTEITNAEIAEAIVENAIGSIKGCLEILEKQFCYQKEFKLSRELQAHLTAKVTNNFLSRENDENLSPLVRKFNGLADETQTAIIKSSFVEIIGRINAAQPVNAAQFKL